MTWFIVTIVVLVLIGLWQAWDQWHLRRSLDKAHDAIEELDLTLEEGQAAHEALQAELDQTDAALAIQKTIAVAAKAVIEVLAPRTGGHRTGRRCGGCGMYLGPGVAGHMQDCKYARVLDIYMGVTGEIHLDENNERPGPQPAEILDTGTYGLSP